MIHELDEVVLTTDLPGHRLQSGDIGTVVHLHDEGAGYTVEFMTLEGVTVAVVTLQASQVRPVADDEMPHVRKIEVV